MQNIQKILYYFTLLLAFFIPLFFVLYKLVFEGIPFWYDPARDLISAQANLKQITLIGPTTSIPGIYYGPYWIWLLSFGLLFSEDPVHISILTGVIPFSVFFPIIWSRFVIVFSKPALLLVWLLFIFTSGHKYATEIWNPHISLPIALTAIYILLTLDRKRNTIRQICHQIFLGILVGLIVNFHVSFGLGFAFGVALFLFAESIFQWNLQNENKLRYSQKRLLLLGTVFIGFLSTFLPYLIYDIKEGFPLSNTIWNSITHLGGNTGKISYMTKPIIMNYFMEMPFKLFGIQQQYGSYITYFLICCLGYIFINKKKHIRTIETRIVIITLFLLLGTFILYTNVKNPVYDYHFIGVELYFMIIIAFIISRMRFLMLTVVNIMLLTVISSTLSLYVHSRIYFISDLQSKKDAVHYIQKDAKKEFYNVYPFCHTLVCYEYTYLFKWIINKDIPYDLSKNRKANLHYIIVPNIDKKYYKDIFEKSAPRTEYTLESHTYLGMNEIYKYRRNISK